ncbi:hypothetical protein G6F22_019117 [Rhizopus arrhizus]|nr:hypothetical protein G6F22_019117 [Rhizopus arrhizus]KAG0921962.1 hypothetical protein G6F32_014874 [Rhizopus arrhizus]
MRGSVVSMPRPGARTPRRPSTTCSPAPTSGRPRPAAGPAPGHAGATRSANGPAAARCTSTPALPLRRSPGPGRRRCAGPSAAATGHGGSTQSAAGRNAPAGRHARSATQRSCRDGARPAAAAG